MTDDKYLRFQVLQMAQTMCDQEYLMGQEIKRDAKRNLVSEVSKRERKKK